MGVKAIHQSPVLDGRWFPLPSRLKEMQKMRRITYCDSSCFCLRHHLLYLFPPMSTRIHAAKQKSRKVRTDNQMQQKGLHGQSSRTAQDQSEIEYIIDPLSWKSWILRIRFIANTTVTFRGQQRRRLPDNPTLRRKNSPVATAHGPFANPQTSETERVLKNGRRVRQNRRGAHKWARLS